MKSLQLVVPFQTCPFRCPFCIANNPSVETAFANLYQSDKRMYMTLLLDVIDSNHDLKTVVITGDTEPTLNMEWLITVAQTIKFLKPYIQLELQTKNFNEKTIKRLLFNTKIDVYGFSVDTVEQYNAIRFSNKDYFWNPSKMAEKRLTLLLNSRLNLDEIDVYFEFSQITIKYLQKGDNEKINKWIDEHTFTDTQALQKFIKRHSKLSVMVDENCMASEGRYSIFRSDGFLYKTWTDLPK